MMCSFIHKKLFVYAVPDRRYLDLNQKQKKIVNILKPELLWNLQRLYQYLKTFFFLLDILV